MSTLDSTIPASPMPNAVQPAGADGGEPVAWLAEDHSCGPRITQIVQVAQVWAAQGLSVTPLIRSCLAPKPAPEGQKEASLRDKIEAEARRYAGMYPETSDGRNTFVMFADWIATLSAPVHTQGSE